jgi:hypothetical protein
MLISPLDLCFLVVKYFGQTDPVTGSRKTDHSLPARVIENNRKHDQ